MSKLVALQAMQVARDAPLQDDVASDVLDPARSLASTHLLEPKSCWTETLDAMYDVNAFTSVREFDFTDQRTQETFRSRPMLVYEERSQRSVNLEWRINHWATQLFYIVLTFGHCSCYVVDLHEMTAEELKELSLWILFTGVPLSCLTVLELVVRVRSQTGGILSLKFWLRFLKPLFHKLEICVFFVMSARGALACYNLYLGITQGQVSDEMHGSDKMSILLLIFYRAMRAWDIFYAISVQRTEQQWSARQKADPPWLDEHKELLAKYNSRPVVRLQRQIDRGNVQTLIFLIVLAHCGVYSFTRIVDGWERLYWYTKPSGYLILLIFSTEFAARCYAQGGEIFFEPVLHKIEVLFLILGMFMVAYSTWYHAAIKEEKSSFEFAGSATALVITIHRFFRFIGIWYGVSASELEVGSVLEAKAISFIQDKFGDLLQVPPQNFSLSLASMMSGYFEVALRKAHINPEVMREMHLPLAVIGGLVEEFQLKAPDPLHVESVSEDCYTTLTVENLLLIVGPGNGLAEAGGLGAAGEHYWTYENVLERKGKLVDFFFKYLSPAAPKQGPEEKAEEDEAESPKLGFFQNKVMSHKKSYEKVLMRRIQLHIKNVTVQYQDSNGLLGRGYVTIGGKVGKIVLDRRENQMTQVYCSRVGMFIETQTKAEADERDTKRERQGPIDDASKNGALWRDDLCKDLAREEVDEETNGEVKKKWRQIGQRKTMERFKYLNRREIILLSIFANLHRVRPLTTRQYHRHCERWPGRKFVWWALGIRLIGNPLAQIDRACQKESGPARALGQDIPDDWHWGVSVTPIRICIDDEQIRCLRSLRSCLKAYSIHDNAFGWRPDVGPQERKDELEVLMNRLALNDSFRFSLRLLERGPKDPEQAVELLKDVLVVVKTARKEVLDETRLKVEEQLKSGADARRTVSKMWWIYAIHRVLARKHIQPVTPWVAIGWHSAKQREYTMLLSDVADASNITAKNRLHDWKFRPWQTRWARDLEVRLKIPEIVACRKLALRNTLDKIDKNANEEHKRKKETLRKRLVRDLDAQARTDTPNMHTSAKLKAAWISLKEGRIEEIRVDLRQKGKEMAQDVAQFAAETGVEVGYALAEAVQRNDNEIGRSPSKLLKRRPGEKAEFASVTSDGKSGTQAAMIDKFTGTWKIEVPQIDVRILRWNAASRKVLLHTQMKHLAIHAEITGTCPVNPVASKETIVASVLLAGFSIRCPQAGKLTLGGGDEMLEVTRPLLFRQFPDSSITPPNLPEETPTPTGKILRDNAPIFAGHAKFRFAPKDKAQSREANGLAVSRDDMVEPARDNSLGRGVCEVLIPGFRVVIFEPLFVALMNFISPNAEIGATSRSKRMRSRVDYRMVPRGRKEIPLSMRKRPHFSKGIIASTGRQGPLAQSIQVNDTVDSVTTAVLKAKNHGQGEHASDFHDHSFRIMDRIITTKDGKRKLKKTQLIFEVLSGAKFVHDWDVKLDIGAIHCMQVGDYSNSHVFVEEYRVWPFRMDMERGLRKVMDALAAARKSCSLSDNHIMVEANKNGEFPLFEHTEQLDLGLYVVAENQIVVTCSSNQESEIVTRLPSGARVHVVEILEVDGRTRGRIDHPQGWITLKNHKPERVFVVPCKFSKARTSLSVYNPILESNFSGFLDTPAISRPTNEREKRKVPLVSLDRRSIMPKGNCCSSSCSSTTGLTICGATNAKELAVEQFSRDREAVAEVVEMERKATGSTIGWQSKNPTVEVTFRAIAKPALKAWITSEDKKWMKNVYGQSRTRVCDDRLQLDVRL